MSALTFVSIYKIIKTIKISKVNREEKKKHFRKKILEVYKELLDTVGYDGATTSAISKKSGIAEGTIFNHFSTKGDLLLSVYSSHFFLSAEEYIKDNPFNGEPVEWLLNYIKCFVKKTEEFPKDCLRALFALG